ncbi:hypothetical protein H632_c275p1 [Helicosporidium sp. ATCC 50920]|nr:hypothetical protein H632_c275p1 [Helicosporidium sp. ATCC 50920]|eukprot:KDD76306.1 hypothetical protein H632_c275p1 [Helicosporidium sp. ATCC 50920]
MGEGAGACPRGGRQRRCCPCPFQISGLANVSGVGGGTIFVPLYALTMHENIKTAMALSQVSIAAGSFITVVLGVFRRHPSHPSWPLIDYRYGVLVGPAMLFGSGVGVVLQALFPSWLITTLLVVALVPICAQTIRRVILMTRAESEARRAASAQAESSKQLELVPILDPVAPSYSVSAGDEVPQKRPSLERRSAVPVGTPVLMEDLDDAADQNPEEDALAAPARAPSLLPRRSGSREDPEAGRDPGAGGQGAIPKPSEDSLPGAGPAPGQPLPKLEVPWPMLGFLVGVWAVFLGLQLARTTQETCSWSWILIFAVQSLCTIGPSCVMAYFVLRAVKRYVLLSADEGGEKGSKGAGETTIDLPNSNALDSASAKQALAPLKPWEEMLSLGATKLSVAKVLVAWFVTLFGGVLGSMLGLGGGVVVVPLLLELGVHAQAAGLTSTVMVFFVSSATMAVYAAKGIIPGRAAGILASASLLGAAAGVLVVTEAIRRSGRVSLIAITLMCVLLVGTALTIAFPLREAIQDMVDYGVPGFNHYCYKTESQKGGY